MDLPYPAQPYTANPTQVSIDKKQGLKKKQGLSGADAPAIPAELLSDFLAVRKAKKAGPLTPTALAGIQREADKAGLTLVEAVTACCEYGWQGFNAGWYAERTAKTPAAAMTPGRRSTGGHKYAAAAAAIFDFDDNPAQSGPSEVIDV